MERVGRCHQGLDKKGMESDNWVSFGSEENVQELESCDGCIIQLIFTNH